MLGTRTKTKTTIQRHSLLQRQANVYSNQSSWFVWGLSVLGAYKTRKKNMKQFITKHTEKKLRLIPTTMPLPTVLYEKKKSVIDYRIVLTIKSLYHVLNFHSTSVSHWIFCS